MRYRNFILLLFIIIIIIFTVTPLLSNAAIFHKKDIREQEAEYIQKVLKEDEKENYKKRLFYRNPTGYMMVSEYEKMSEYKDKTKEKSKVPKQAKSADMKYVPQPTYKIVRYNEPPGSPELNITTKIYKLRQYNGQGITSPDYKIMVYPVVYYYPDSASMASDLFVIPLSDKGTPLNKIMTANAKKRHPQPILSTDKSIDNFAVFRSLTPVDFSQDGTKLLVKEKVGTSADGIWKTDIWVYDFDTETSYYLVEVREAIMYYWKNNKGVDLEEHRWDVIPLGFLKDEPERVVVAGYAYTGKAPIFLGVWSIDSHGEQSRLVTFDIEEVQVSQNGFKIIQDGVVKPVIVKNEDKALKKSDKVAKKQAKNKDKEIKKMFKAEYKAKIKQIDEEFKEENKELNKLYTLEGTTELNDIPEKYRQIRLKELEKEIKRLEKQLKKYEQKTGG